ncbi:uncharacterized protein [Dysidea avara]|uniref:uncharacterized protein isoform X2 n=1 Tax=Dysidea avara TaxID=196820 RepID=UPI0033223958
MSLLSIVKKEKTSFARILQDFHYDLRQSLSLPQLIPLLNGQGLLTTEEWEELSCKATTLQSIDRLVQILPRKGENAYAKFVNCLESESEHPAHQELADKLTAIHPLQPSHSKESHMVTSTLIGQLMTVIQPFLDEQNAKIASLEAQLVEKGKHSAYQDELTKYQRLLEYANGGQPLPDCNTRTLAEHYHDVQLMLKRVRLRLKQDTDHVRRFIASEDSDSMRSRTSSMDSEGQPNGVKNSNRIPKPSSGSTLTIEEESEEATSSADETDDDLDTQLDPEQEKRLRVTLKKVTAFNRSRQRPESWPASKKKRASKTCSHHFVRETSTTDSDSTCVSHQKGEVISGACKTDINREKDCDENNSMACASVDLTSSVEEYEECSSTVLEGYLLKEGDGDIWRKRYFTLTKEFLFYSKSQQDTRPLGLIPLINLALERKKKKSIELLNKETSSLIKVNKPNKKAVQSYKVIRLRASSEVEMLHWVKNIEDVITNLTTLYHTS